jgi:amino acid efflux transporter
MHNNKIGAVVATAMSITIVVGAGLLALPGLSFSLAGKFGYLPWVFVAILMVPLLYIFSYFGANNPSAGGVVGYIRVALGQRLASMAEMIVLGTFTLGIPAIALIGSEYLRQAAPEITVLQAGLLVIGLAYIAGVVGLKLSGTIQTVIAAFIVIGLSAIAVTFLFNAKLQTVQTPLNFEFNQFKGVVSAIPIILFAYTGWEMTAFLAEDMKNPKRDMPISIWASFIIVVLMYVFIAWTVATFADNNESWKLTPFIELAKNSFGQFGGVAVGIIAALLVVANVIAAFISASRGIYSAGRDGFLPKIIGSTNKDGQPMIAMTMTWLLFSTIVLVAQEGGFGAESLLQLAGQNFFVLYLLCSIGFAKIHYGMNVKFLVSIIAIVSVSMMLTLFSLPGVIYCSVLAIAGLIFSKKHAA